MTDLKHEVKRQLDAGLEELRSMRDEIRVRLHLGGMDAKDAWDRLEPRLERVEAEARHAKDEVVDSVRHAIEDLKKAFSDLRENLG